MSEIIATQRLRLREIVADDLPVLQQIFGDEACMRHYPAVKTLEETTAWFQNLAFDSYARHGFGLWAVVDKTSGALIGDCGITLQRTSAGIEPEIGAVVPMERAEDAFREMWGGRTRGKTVFTR